MKRSGQGLFFIKGRYDTILHFLKVYGDFLNARDKWDTVDTVGTTIYNTCSFVRKEVLMSPLIKKIL